MATEPTNVVEIANPGGLKPRVAISFFAFCGVAMLLAYAASQALNNRTITSKGTLEEGPAGLIYRNPHEGIELTVPVDWNDRPSETMLARFHGNGASFLVEERFATDAVDSMLNATKKELQASFPTITFTPKTRKFSGKFSSGFEASYKNQGNVLIHQRVFGIRRGFKMLILIGTWTRDEDRPIVDQIEQSIRLE